MRAAALTIEPSGDLADRLDRAMECLLVVLLAFMPLALGVVAAWSELVFVGVTGVLVALLAGKLLACRQIRFIWTWAYVPVAAFALLAAVQLVPLPVGVVKIISPGTAEMHARLLGDLASDRVTVSFYPNATAHDLRLVLGIAAVFVVVVNVYRRPEQIKRLLGGIALIGGGVALLSLAQTISGTQEIYWSIPIGHTADSGPFVNHSNFGQFMNLSIGAALGWILMRLHQEFRHGPLEVTRVFRHLAPRELPWVWILAGVVVFGVASVFMSMTRGGMISLLIAGAFTAVMLSLKRGLRGRGWVIAIMAILSFIVVLYVGFDAVYERLATLSDQRAEGGRTQIVEDIASAWMKFPVMGVGLGTHETVYPMFDRSTIPSVAGHAENEYAQAAEEMGALGLAALVLFAVIVCRAFVRCVRSLTAPVRSAAFGLGFGLLAVLIHSLSDFGQHLPANASLTALFSGLLIVCSRMGHQDEQPVAAQTDRVVSKSSRLLGAAMPVCLVVALGWGFLAAEDARQAEAHWADARAAEKKLTDADRVGTNAEYASLISATQKAVDCAPDNVKYRHWLSVYRWRSISRVVNPKTGKLVLPPRGPEYAHRIVEEMAGTRALCPTFGATPSVMGQLEWYVLGRPEGKDNIRLGYELAPCDPVSCFVAGKLDILEGRIDEGYVKLSRTLELDGGRYADIVNLVIRRADPPCPDLAIRLAGNDYGRLLKLERILRDDVDHGQLAADVRRQAIEILKARVASPDATAGELASVAAIYEHEKDVDDAIEHYRRALSLDYGQVGWRIRYARLLGEAGRIEDAIHEARICLRLQPQMAAARKLIETLSVRPTDVRD